MLNIGNIIKGGINDALGLNKDIQQTRLLICYSCPLYSLKFGGLCNNKLWLNPLTQDVSTERKDGYKRGCGCKLTYKTSVVNEKCPLGKW